jgi:hypothetical protein
MSFSELVAVSVEQPQLVVPLAERAPRGHAAELREEQHSRAVGGRLSLETGIFELGGDARPFVERRVLRKDLKESDAEEDMTIYAALQRTLRTPEPEVEGAVFFGTGTLLIVDERSGERSPDSSRSFRRSSQKAGCGWTGGGSFSRAGAGGQENEKDRRGRIE